MLSTASQPFIPVMVNCFIAPLCSSKPSKEYLPTCNLCSSATLWLGTSKLVATSTRTYARLNPSAPLHISASSEDLSAEDVFFESTADDDLDLNFPYGGPQRPGSDDIPKVKKVTLRAPNGLQDDTVTDFMQELLPVMSKQEREAERKIPEEEQHMRRLLKICISRVESSHRASKRLDNLKPYKLRRKEENVCETCSGRGMTICDYCKGEGFVDLGENGEKFESIIGDNEVLMPKHVMGSIYHCPICGGLQEERCVVCFGTGEDPTVDKGNQPRGASASERTGQAWKLFDMSLLSQDEQDRIEVGSDGIIILRARKRKKRAPNRTKVTGKNAKVDSANTPEDRSKEEEKLSDIISEVPHITSVDDLDDVAMRTANVQSASARRLASKTSRYVGRSTDFVNTTDYQVGKRLQEQRKKLSEPAGQVSTDDNEDCIESDTGDSVAG